MIIFEDEHLLVANKPPGLNTHAPSPYAGEGLYEWLKNSSPPRAALAIIHRLDKETSGLMVFGKSTPANRSLTGQFEQRAVRKKYVLLTDRDVSFTSLTARSWLKRAGDKYISLSAGPEGGHAETSFHRIELPSAAPGGLDGCFAWEAQPATGRTHQIRVHAAAHGFPIVGDTLYGGTPAARLCLHAAQLGFRHPISGADVLFASPPDFAADPRAALRAAVIDPSATDAFRLVHGAADGWPGLYVERLGGFLLSESAGPLTEEQGGWLRELARRFSSRGCYHRIVRRRTAPGPVPESGPRWFAGDMAPDELVVRENGLRFALRLSEGGGVGLFLDQRENRRRLLTGHIAPDFTIARPARVLNAFAYTCGFSVCAAAGGAHATSLDLSRKYLDWGKRNFVLNGLDPAAHDFIYGDAFDWFRRLAKKGLLFDVIVLDPPTFSRSKEHGVFQAERDFGALAAAALPLLARDGILLASANAATLQPDRFLDMVMLAVSRAGRRVTQQHYAPQPPDFPVHPLEPAYLKTVWLRIGGQ